VQQPGVVIVKACGGGQGARSAPGRRLSGHATGERAPAARLTGQSDRAERTGAARIMPSVPPALAPFRGGHG
jgi:hypothetical protein